MVRFGGHIVSRSVGRALLSASSLAATSVLTSMASAQEAAGSGDTVLAEVVVTAQMREQNVQDIPLSITAVTGDMLEARSQTNLKEISAQAPNVLLQQNPAGSGNSMRAFIRGVGQSDHSPSVEPGVGIYVDDIYFGTVTASAFDLLDLERVEILRGPQGTLSGMNSQGGSIKLYSRKPGTGREGGHIEATLGNYGRRDLKASADFTVIPDKVFARVTGVARNRDGHVTLYNYACVNPDDPDVISGAIPSLIRSGDCKSGELGNQQMYAVRGTLRIAPADSRLEINLIGDYTKDTSSTQASVLIASAESASKGTANPQDRSAISVPYQGVAYDDRFVTYGQYRRPDARLNDPYASYANFYDPGVTYRAIGLAPPPAQAVPGPSNGPYIAANASQVEAWGISATIDYELSDNFALKSITGYRSYDTMSGMDNDNSPVVFIQSTDWFGHEQFSQEIRVTGNLVDDTVHLTVGGIYFEASTRPLSRIHTPFSGFGPPGFPTFSFLNDDTADMEVTAGFANVAWDVTDALTLEGGIRVTDEQKDYTFGRLNPDGAGDYLPLSNPGNPLTGWTGTYSDTVTDYRAAVSYKLAADAMIYAQFATGHKAGGISPRPYSYHQIRPFGPETLDSYEAGFKVDLLGRAIRLNGSVFHMDYQDYQGIPQVCVGVDGQPLPEDAGGVPGLCGQYLNLADAKVKGFELETLIRPVVGLSIDGAVSYVDFEFGAPRYATNDVREGSSRPGIGKWKWSVGAQYELELGHIGTLTPRIDVARTPGYCGNFACDPNATVDSYVLTNARLTFDTLDGDWSVSLEATNLTDKLYYVNKFLNQWYVSGQPGRPREYALSVRRRF
ncbi:MAG: TonB-dependent receptor [Proteobacteria bacterium]|nr:MAG: TonB-dependent receptor [Pseudomonadota bacterium]